MPVNNLARREFLYKIKERGLDIDELARPLSPAACFAASDGVKPCSSFS